MTTALKPITFPERCQPALWFGGIRGEFKLEKEMHQKVQLQLGRVCIRWGSSSIAVFFSLEVSRAKLFGHTDLVARLGLGRNKQLGKEGKNFSYWPVPPVKH